MTRARRAIGEALAGRKGERTMVGGEEALDMATVEGDSRNP